MDKFLKRESASKSERSDIHVGDMDSYHSNVLLMASIDASRYLLRQGLSFSYDEKEECADEGNFLALLKYTTEHNDVVRKVSLENAPKYNQMTSPSVQKDIVFCFAEEVMKSIIEEIDGGAFGLFFDESFDVFHKVQMVVVLRFVDKTGRIKERFIGVVHVEESLKSGMDDLFAKYGLSLKNVRGLSYDGTSNMKDEFNGLRSLILKENSSGYYVHCFAHQLQLVVVAVAKSHFDVGHFFDMISKLLNVVGASCNRKDMLREKYREEILKGLNNGGTSTGKGKNQECSHYKTLLCLVELFSSVIEVLEYIESEGVNDSKKLQAYNLLNYFHTFDFVFYLQLMLVILGLSDNLSMCLQRRDQDILNAVSLVQSTKRVLQKLRDDGWDSLMVMVSSFCKKHGIEILMMEDVFVDPMMPQKKTNITNLHHYKIDCFNVILDLQLQELNDRFTEVNTQLLTCMASLSPIGSFKQFDKAKLETLAEFYPDDFSAFERSSLHHQLDIYIDNLREDKRFANLESLGDLSHLMVKTQKHLAYPLVYRLLKLALILPVATANVERCFSTMKLVKTISLERIGDQFLSDCLVCFVEEELFESVRNETVMNKFQNMATRRICS